MKNRPLAAAAWLLAVLATGSNVGAAPDATDPAIVRISHLDDALLAATKAADMKTRISKLSPAIGDAFNLSIMAQFVVGPAWAGLSSTERSGVTLSLWNYLSVRLAHDLAQSSKPSFTVDPVAQTRGRDKIVRTQIADPNEEADRLDYRMRQYNGDWRVIDVIYNGVSELATQRADLANTITKGGASALIARMDQTTAKLRTP